MMCAATPSSLREAVLAGGWPTLDAARGKILFAIDSGAANVELYLRGHASLEGHVMFVNAISEDAEHAAYFTMNNPIKQGDLIRERVAKGYLVRTRADANTIEARDNDTTKRDAAYASGAQYISTDYYLPTHRMERFQCPSPRRGGSGVQPGSRCLLRIRKRPSKWPGRFLKSELADPVYSSAAPSSALASASAAAAAAASASAFALAAASRSAAAASLRAAFSASF